MLHAWRHATDEANDFFVEEEVGCVGFGGAPEGDVGDEVWVGECVIELDEGFTWQEFVDVFECVDEWLEFAGDVIDVVVEFEVALELESEEFSGAFVFKGDVVDLKFNVGEGSWVEGSVGGLGGVRDKVVVVEVGDEIVEVVLGVFLEGVEIGCRDDKCGVVGVREGVGEGCCVADVVDVEEEEVVERVLPWGIPWVMVS